MHTTRLLLKQGPKMPLRKTRGSTCVTQGKNSWPLSSLHAPFLSLLLLEAGTPNKVRTINLSEIASNQIMLSTIPQESLTSVDILKLARLVRIARLKPAHSRNRLWCSGFCRRWIVSRSTPRSSSPSSWSPSSSSLTGSPAFGS